MSLVTAIKQTQVVCIKNLPLTTRPHDIYRLCMKISIPISSISKVDCSRSKRLHNNGEWAVSFSTRADACHFIESYSQPWSQLSGHHIDVSMINDPNRYFSENGYHHPIIGASSGRCVMISNFQKPPELDILNELFSEYELVESTEEPFKINGFSVLVKFVTMKEAQRAIRAFHNKPLKKHSEEMKLEQIY